MKPTLYVSLRAVTLAPIAPIAFIAVLVSLALPPAAPAQTAGDAIEQIGVKRGICAVLGLPPSGPKFVIDLIEGSQLKIYFQSPDRDVASRVREAASAAGLLGKRIFAAEGDWQRIHLADNVADAIWVAPGAADSVKKEELLRVIHPEARAVAGDSVTVKPPPPGLDDWSHPYHGPDNNPQSADLHARAPYLTQFLANPKFSPMPEVSVASGGRVFKAFGHIAHKANQNPVLNTLLGINGYNGVILWRRPLKEGFMIHRNTMIATPDTLYLGDDESCKLIDARTGAITSEIVVPADLSDGPVWKWMGMEDGVLYALVGAPEVPIRTQPSNRQGLGHWPWGMWAGHDYKDPRTNFGFGRTLLAFDAKTGDVKWHHRTQEYIDSRGVCMKNKNIYIYAPEKYLASIDATTGKRRWTSRSAELLAAIGPNGRAQHYVTGYATTTYIKCDDERIYFAGPQRERLVVASARDGRLLWQKEGGNLQLVLRREGVYAAGPRTSGAKLDYDTGKVLVSLPRRRACTRATGSVDSIFYRTPGGTVRVETATNSAKHIAPMRPPCQDGVLIAGGHLYWGPWMCGCQLSLYGHICLGPARDHDYDAPADASRLEREPDGEKPPAGLAPNPGDWQTARGNARRSAVTSVSLPEEMSRLWTFRPQHPMMPSAPVVSGGVAFTGDRAGVVRAVSDDGKLRWKSYTGGAVYFPPAVHGGRVFVGSADGRVYAFAAATGRRLWSFRVAPVDRWIPVYGKLISTWPVAGGVVVKEGIVYAAAGIAHFDGTHVVALEAATGRVKWYNSSSGRLSKTAESGVSLQGELYATGGELRFKGGGIYKTARFDLKTGKCLNEPHHGVNSRFQTAFYPYYPRYAEHSSLDHTFDDGVTLHYSSSYEGSRHSKLQLLGLEREKAPPRKRRQDRRRDRREPRDRRKVLWEVAGARYNGWIVSPEVLVAAGRRANAEGKAFLAVYGTRTGKEHFRTPLPEPAVKDGLAVGGRGRVIVSLRDGRLVCFGRQATEHSPRDSR